MVVCSLISRGTTPGGTPLPLPVTHVVTRPVPLPLPLPYKKGSVVCDVAHRAGRLSRDDWESLLEGEDQLLFGVVAHAGPRAACLLRAASRDICSAVEWALPELLHRFPTYWIAYSDCREGISSHMNNRPTEALADAALAKSQRLMRKLSNLGLDADLDDRGYTSPTSSGGCNTTWGSPHESGSSSESEDESWREVEHEHGCDTSWKSLEEELCVRLARIEEELQLMRELDECGHSCNGHLDPVPSLVPAPAPAPVASRGAAWSTFLMSLDSLLGVPVGQAPQATLPFQEPVPKDHSHFAVRSGLASSMLSNISGVQADTQQNSFKSSISNHLKIRVS